MFPGMLSYSILCGRMQGCYPYLPELPSADCPLEQDVTWSNGNFGLVIRNVEGQKPEDRNKHYSGVVFLKNNYMTKHFIFIFNMHPIFSVLGTHAIIITGEGVSIID